MPRRHDHAGKGATADGRGTAEGNFSRSVTLPAEVDPSRARTQLKDGVLEVTLPKNAGMARKQAID